MMWILLSVLASPLLAWPTLETLSSSDIQTILRVHNTERQATEDGTVDGSPTASNNPPISWSSELANLAAIEVTRKNAGGSDCYSTHHPDGPAKDNSLTGADSIGENIARHSDASIGLEWMMTGWWVEKYCYKYGTAGGTEECSDVGDCQCGHYTQMVWAATTQVGCALVRDCAGSMKTRFLCLYKRAGNLQGSSPFACESSTCAKNSIAAPDPASCLQVSNMWGDFNARYELQNDLIHGKKYWKAPGAAYIVWSGTRWVLRNNIDMSQRTFYSNCLDGKLAAEDCQWWGRTQVSVPAGCSPSGGGGPVAPSPTTPPPTTPPPVAAGSGNCIKAVNFHQYFNGVYTWNAASGKYERVWPLNTAYTFVVATTGRGEIRRDSGALYAYCATSASYSQCTSWKAYGYDGSSFETSGVNCAEQLNVEEGDGTKPELEGVVEEEESENGQWWLWLVLIGAALVLVIGVFMMVRAYKMTGMRRGKAQFEEQEQKAELGDSDNEAQTEMTTA